jgi:hypothetical protein
MHLDPCLFLCLAKHADNPLNLLDSPDSIHSGPFASKSLSLYT